MKKTRLSEVKKGQLFKEDKYNNNLYEMCFTVPNAGGYGGAKGEGTSAYVLKKEGFTVSFLQIFRKDTDEILLIEPEDMKSLSEVEARIRETAKYVELYKIAEVNSEKENLVGTYPSSSSFGETAFKRGDVVEDEYGRLGIVLGIDGHSVAVINRVDYRVEVGDGEKKGTGIFRADEIKKKGRLDDEEIKSLKP